MTGVCYNTLLWMCTFTTKTKTSCYRRIGVTLRMVAGTDGLVCTGGLLKIYIKTMGGGESQLYLLPPRPHPPPPHPPHTHTLPYVTVHGCHGSASEMNQTFHSRPERYVTGSMAMSTSWFKEEQIWNFIILTHRNPKHFNLFFHSFSSLSMYVWIYS